MLVFSFAAFFCSHQSRHKIFATLLGSLIGIIIFLPLHLGAETVSPAPGVTNASSATPEQQYKAATDYFAQLERDDVGKDRNNWLNGAKNFQRIYAAQKKEALGPASLFMLAKLQKRMYDHFKIPADLEESIERYIEIASLYPAHSLADDALFTAAENSALIKGKEQQATKLYQKIVDVYPKSTHFEKASARIQEKKEKVLVSEVISSNSEAAQKLVQIAPIKFWTSTDYTRIVIPTSATVAFAPSLIDKETNRSRKLRIDFARSTLTHKSNSFTQLAKGPLKQLQFEQLNNETVRVHFDIAPTSDYKIFSLNDPFRVVVDILGQTTPTDKVDQEDKTTATLRGTQNAPQKDKFVTADDEPADSGIISLEDQKKRDPKLDIPKQSDNKEKLSLAQQLGLGFRKVILDPGHGGKDPGAMAFNIKEKDIALKVAKKAAQILKSTYRYEVVLTRTTDTYLPLEERTAIANSQHGDLFISIHVNASSDKNKGGIETYFLNLATNADAMRVAALENATSKHNISELQDILANLMKKSKMDESSRLAEFIQTNLVAGVENKYRIHDLGVKQAPFFVLIGAEMPAILSEIAFITNPSEARLLQDEHYLNKLAEQFAAGVAAYADHHHTAAIKF